MAINKPVLKRSYVVTVLVGWPVAGITFFLFGAWLGYLAGVTFFFFIGSVLAIFIAPIAHLWIAYSRAKKGKESPLLGLAIFSTIAGILIVLGLMGTFNFT